MSKSLSVSVAITGASGVKVALRLLEVMTGLGIKVKGVIVTRAAEQVAFYEEGYKPEEFRGLVGKLSKAPVYSDTDFSSPLASSSNQPDAMIIVPASMKTLSLIARSEPSTLTSRAALAIIRLGRRLVVAPRETPLGELELETLLRLARLGAIIVPLCPGFYTRPATISDLVDFMVGKLLDALGVRADVYKRWGSEAEHSSKALD